MSITPIRKGNKSDRTKNIIRLATTAVAAPWIISFGSAAHATPTYTGVPLYTLTQPTWASYANPGWAGDGFAAGSGVAISNGYTHAMLWPGGNPAVDLNPTGFYFSYLSMVNGAQEVGSAQAASTPGGNNTAFLWSGTAASAVNLNPSWANNSAASGIAGSEQVGYASGTSTGSNDHAVLWTGTAASAVDLNPSGFVNSSASGTDGVHQVGDGSGPTTSNLTHALLWSGTAASAIDLNPSGFTFSNAGGVSGTQQVGTGYGPSTGTDQNGFPLDHALVWNGTAASAVDLNPTGFSQSYANATNGSIQVGYGYENNDNHALLWSGTAASAFDLNTGLPAAYGFVSAQAFRVNAAGDIWGIGYTPYFGYAVEWVPGAADVWTNNTGNGLWDNGTSTNWNNNVNSFQAGDNVFFTDINNGFYSVTLNTTVSPASTTVDNESGDYIITGTGNISGSGSVTKIGSRTLTLHTVNTYTGGTTIAEGTLIAAVNGAIPNGSVSITGGTLQLARSTGLAKFTSLSISGGGTFDLTNNHVIINYAGTPDPISSIAARLKSGFNNGAWNGPGINSSTAATTPGYSLGYADSADPGNPAGLSSGQIEIKYTLLGDADLNGTVNGVDFGILAANFNHSVSRWDQGDFNYDGIVNGIDFTALAANFNKAASGAAGLSDLSDPALVAFAQVNGLMADVPEPTLSGAVVAIAACAIHQRRRRFLAK
jgi:autotransporter-associated beta strand protein